MEPINPDQPEMTPEEQLRADNEIAALNLELNYGGIVHSGEDVPPEIVQQFLANVTAFEKMHQKGVEYTTIYERIGSPPFAAPDLLDADTLPGEIERIMRLLVEKDIIVGRFEDLDDDIFYRFLIEDVFPAKIEATWLPGMVTFFDFDELNPNDDKMIAVATEIFLLTLLNLQEPFTGDLLNEICRDDHNILSRKEALDIVTRFRGSYSLLIPVAFKLEELIQPGNGTYQTFGISWKGVPIGGGDMEVYEGLGVVQLSEHNGDWLVEGVQMPGFKF